MNLWGPTMFATVLVMIFTGYPVAFSLAESLVSTVTVHVWAAPVFSLIRSSIRRGTTRPEFPERAMASSVAPRRMYAVWTSRVIARAEPSSSTQLNEPFENIW